MDEKLNILVADHAKESADPLVDLLVHEGHNVAISYDAQSAIEACRGRPFDLVLLELMLPGLTGQKCLIEIRKILPDSNIYTVTGRELDHLTREAISKGALGILKKPIDPSRLLAITEGMSCPGANSPVGARVVD